MTHPICALLYEDDFELGGWRVRVDAAREPGATGFFARSKRGDRTMISRGATREEAIEAARAAIQERPHGRRNEDRMDGRDVEPDNGVRDRLAGMR